MDETRTQDVRGFSDEMLLTLAEDSVRSIVQLIDLARLMFPQQLAALRVGDDLAMTSQVLRRVLAHLDAH